MKDDLSMEELEKNHMPPELVGKLFLTTQEFAKIAGVTRECIYGWAKAGHIRLKKYSPRRSMVPKDEVFKVSARGNDGAQSRSDGIQT
jgi:hypothetical protein